MKATIKLISQTSDFDSDSEDENYKNSRNGFSLNQFANTLKKQSLLIPQNSRLKGKTLPNFSDKETYYYEKDIPEKGILKLHTSKDLFLEHISKGINEKRSSEKSVSINNNEIKQIRMVESVKLYNAQNSYQVRSQPYLDSKPLDVEKPKIVRTLDKIYTMKKKHNHFDDFETC